MRSKNVETQGEIKGDALQAFLVAVRVGEAAAHANLTVVPLFAPPSGPLVVTLDEALRSGKAEVTEVGEHGSVPTLNVVNRHERPLLIFDGEELVGAKQNRIVNTTLLVAAGAALPIPVSCVEQGRWSWRSKRFGTAGRILKPEMRRSKAARISATLAEHPGTYDANQGTVWREVSAYNRRRGVASATDAMSDAYDKDRIEIDSYLRALPAAQPEQSGMAAYVNGRLVGLDVLGRPEAYAALHEKLLRSFAAEAVDLHGAPARKRLDRSVVDALRGLGQAHRIESQPPGVGRDVRLQARELHAAMLLADDGVVHLAAFPQAG